MLLDFLKFIWCELTHRKAMVNGFLVCETCDFPRNPPLVHVFV